MSGPHTGKAVRPTGEEILCDEYGRVLVQFPWDRRDYNDERASCWVRMNNPLGGGQMGRMFLPLIG
jgi:type VI secretion system secreted protein VgrG